MNIAVAIRLMPKAGDELEVDESGTDIDRELVEMVINEFDDQALEEAVLLKEATGATVTAVGLRSDGIDEALRLAYARGADRLVVVEAGEIDAYDSRTAALAFAEAFRQLAPDLVLTGVQTPIRRVRSDGALPRRRRSAGRRRASSSVSPWPTEPRAWCRSTPAGASPCSASSCRRSSACSPQARRRGTWRWPGSARR